MIIDLKKALELNAADTDITEFYPEFVFDNDYLEDAEKNIIDDDELAMLVEKLESENRHLKSELKAWTHEFGKKARLSDLLIKENKLIKQHLCQKDKDIVVLLQNLACGYGQDMQLLEHRIHELT